MAEPIKNDTRKASKGSAVRSAFAENLRKLRGDKSQAEFAAALGIPHQQTYQRYESGVVPSGEILHRMAKVLGVTLDQLFTPGALDGVSPIFALDTFIRDNFKAKPIPELSFDELQKCLSHSLEMITKSVPPIKSIYATAFLLLNGELQKRMENPPSEVRAKMEQWCKEQGLKPPKK